MNRIALAVALLISIGSAPNHLCAESVVVFLPYKYLVGILPVEDESGKLLTEFDPIELEQGTTTAEAKRHKIVFRARIIEIPPQPGVTYVFGCTEKPTHVSFQVRYDLTPFIALYYGRFENSVLPDRVLFSKEARIGADDKARLEWDGRDEGPSHRLIVRGDAGSYTVTASAWVCSTWEPGGTAGFSVARPNAILIGNIYPAHYLHTIDKVFIDHGEDAENFFGGKGGYGTDMIKRAETLSSLLPAGEGYVAQPLKTQTIGQTLGLWNGSALFVWAGHNSDGFLFVYSGNVFGEYEKIKKEIKEFSAIMSPLAPLVAKDPKLLPKELKDLKKVLFDFPVSMADEEVVILASCCTAEKLAALGNKSLIDVCRDRGADVSIGWVDRAYDDKIKGFLKELVESQASGGDLGLLPTLEESLIRARRVAGAPVDNSSIPAVVGDEVDLTEIFLSELPRYGRK
ncbi:MAG: hypothetical protein K8T20_12640 [Planctomycetes bacterium]|nr:hypothetical protein [Planctomycetota bacterium]